MVCHDGIASSNSIGDAPKVNGRCTGSKGGAYNGHFGGAVGGDYEKRRQRISVLCLFMQDNCGLWLAVVMSRDRQVVKLPSL
jgi:hypothetical protein